MSGQRLQRKPTLCPESHGSAKPRRPGSNRKRPPSRAKRICTWRERVHWLGLVGKRSLPGALLVACMSGIAASGYCTYHWLTHSPRFAIASLSISNNERLNNSAIATLLNLPSLPNIFRTDLQPLEERLRSNPWIAHAEISRSLPRSLHINIQEESAAAAIELNGLYLVNDKGTLFKRTDASSNELAGLSIITGIDRSAFRIRPDETREQTMYALDALQRFSQNSDRPRIGEIHLDANRDISLITYDKAIAIHLGHPTTAEFDDRYQAFDIAWRALDQESRAAARAFRIIDHTPSDQVTVAFAEKLN